MSLCENPLRSFSVGNRHIVENRLDLKDAHLSNGTSYQMHAGMQGCVVSLGSNAMSEAAISDDSCLGSWRWNIRTNAMTWSGELNSIVGRDQNAPVPSFKAHSCFYTADSWVQLLSATLVLLNTGRPYELTLQMLHADGTRRWVIVKGEAVCDQFGHVLELCGTVANINERTLVAGDRVTNMRGGHEATGRLIDAQDKENIQIARSLRDNVSQRVSLLAASIQDLSLTATELSPQNLSRLDELWQYTTGILSELDRISEHLHSTSLDLLGLTLAVQSLCREFRTKSGILVEYNCANVGVEKLDDQLVLTLFCVLKEALDNVAKHSRATTCTVMLSHSSGEIVLQVIDNGVGFQSTELDTRSGLGFIRISERLFQIGGSLAVGSAPACGTSIEVRVPLNRAGGEIRDNTVATTFNSKLRVFTQCSI
jgi:two-component system, NarL family, sensor histidine kinase UhpB